MDPYVVLLKEALSFANIIKGIQMEKHSFIDPLLRILQSTAKRCRTQLPALSRPPIGDLAVFHGQDYISNSGQSYLPLDLHSIPVCQRYVRIRRSLSSTRPPNCVIIIVTEGGIGDAPDN